jgi:hypothetical protein
MENPIPNTASAAEQSTEMATPDGGRTRNEVRQGDSHHTNLRALMWAIPAVAIGFVLVFVALSMSSSDQQRAVDKGLLSDQMTTGAPPSAASPSGQ